MSYLPLPLFPADNVAATVTASVWIGVCVVVFFNLRFGWTLSGLVVPGYLVPLLLVKPTAVAVIVIEAIAAYSIVRLASEGWGRLPWWSSFFGRDRFFAIVLVSILVRAGVDGWLLPNLGRWFNERFQVSIDYRNDWHSYGLVVVALLANYFWKPGLRAGLVTSIVTVGFTYLLMRFGMLYLTNLSLGSLVYLYEDMSTSLMASPKAYVLVITTAYLASWMSLRYNWDFNGILIPALLGLLWHEPVKIVVSIAETLWILVLASWVLRLPVWQRTTVEGGRKILVFFSLTALHRLIIAHFLSRFDLVPITDAYGFGYLLTSLLAVKIYDKQSTVRVLRATVQTSMVGAVAGSILGFLLMIGSEVDVIPRAPASRSAAEIAVNHDDRPLSEIVNAEQIRMYRFRIAPAYELAMPTELSAFRHGVIACLRFARDGRPENLKRAADALERANYQLSVIQHRYLWLHEQSPPRGWGAYVLDLQKPDGLLVEVPAPLSEWATVDAGLVMFQVMQGGALAIAGAPSAAATNSGTDLLASRSSPFATFHRLLERENTLQVRGYTASLVVSPSSSAISLGQSHRSATSVSTSLWVKGALPTTLKLSQLKGLLQDVNVQWQDTPIVNSLRDESRRGFAELVLSQRDRRRLRHQASLSARPTSPQVAQVRGSLRHWLQADGQQFARRGTEAFQPAELEEMLFLDQDVVEPLVRLARTNDKLDPENREVVEQMQAIDAAAAALHYQLIMFHDTASDADYCLLTELTPKQRHWGTFVFRGGLRSPYIVEVPRPLYERHTHPFGLSLWQRLDASALLMAGAHPSANTDGSADVAHLANRVNALHLVRQVLLREMKSQPMLILQTRAIQAPVEADIVIATDDGSTRVDQFSEPLRQVVHRLNADGFRTDVVDGSASTAGYEMGLIWQAATLGHSRNKQIAHLWLSPAVRRRFRERVEIDARGEPFRSVGIPTINAELVDYLRGRAPLSKATWDAAIDVVIRGYLANEDVVRLHQLRQEWPDYEIIRFVDASTLREVLLVAAAPGQMPVIYNLEGSASGRDTVLQRIDASDVQAFLHSSAFRLEVRAP